MGVKVDKISVGNRRVVAGQLNIPILKGDKGDNGERGTSGVVLQNEEPTDEEILIWVDTDDDSGSVIDLEKLIGDINSELSTLTTVGGVE